MNEALDDSTSKSSQVDSMGVSHPSLNDEGIYQALLKADKSESLIPIVSGLAQEMNDLLTRIMGSVASIPKGDIKFISQAEEAILEARDITSRLQSLSKTNEGLKRELNIKTIFDDVLKVTAPGSIAKIEVSIDPNTKSIFVDLAQIKQAFQNLVRNAIEAMTPTPQNPTIQLTAKTISLTKDEIIGLSAGEYIQCEVRDNGHGITNDNVVKIWEPFFTTKKHGSGLGLTTSLEIIRRHGGIIGINSEVGVGSVFTVFIPVAQKTQFIQANKAPTVRFKTGRILIVDNDSNIRHVLGAMLDKLDYRTDSARDSDEALLLYKRYFEFSRPFDAVLLDLKIPGISGEEIFKKLSQYDPDVRVIAMTSDHNTEHIKTIRDLGFCGSLIKPFKLSELGEVLITVLGS
jgi:CheY-like chemotaxis protein